MYIYNIMTFYWTYVLKCDLTSYLSAYLTYIQTFYLTFYLALYLTCIQTIYLTFCLTFNLTYVLTYSEFLLDVHSDTLSDCLLSILLILCDILWFQAGNNTRSKPKAIVSPNATRVSDRPSKRVFLRSAHRKMCLTLDSRPAPHASTRHRHRHLPTEMGVAPKRGERDEIPFLHLFVGCFSMVLCCWFSRKQG